MHQSNTYDFGGGMTFKQHFYAPSSRTKDPVLVAYYVHVKRLLVTSET
jgi:hypothetical protein